jgi:hypothetical protein
VFNWFPGRAKVLQELEKQYSRLPNRPELPDSLLKLRTALEDCMRSRQVEDTVLAVKKNWMPLVMDLRKWAFSLQN